MHFEQVKTSRINQITEEEMELNNYLRVAHQSPEARRVKNGREMK
jgi:hypothetical protein